MKSRKRFIQFMATLGEVQSGSPPQSIFKVLTGGLGLNREQDASQLSSTSPCVLLPILVWTPVCLQGGLTSCFTCVKSLSWGQVTPLGGTKLQSFFPCHEIPGEIGISLGEGGVIVSIVWQPKGERQFQTMVFIIFPQGMCSLEEINHHQMAQDPITALYMLIFKDLLLKIGC